MVDIGPFGSITSFWPACANVCLSSDSGGIADIPKALLGATSRLGPACRKSIQRQRCCKLVVVHAREIISGVDVPCTAEEEFIEGRHRTSPHRISDTSQGDLCKEGLRARNGHK